MPADRELVKLEGRHAIGQIREFLVVRIRQEPLGGGSRGSRGLRRGVFLDALEIGRGRRPLLGRQRTPFEIVQRDFREHAVGKDVLLLLDEPGRNLVGNGRQHWRQQIRRPAGDRLLLAEDLLRDYRIHGGGGFAILAADVVTRLFGHHGVALAGEDIEHGLDADDLAGRGNEGRITHVGPGLRQFRQHLGQAVERALVGKLRAQVGDHPPGNVVEQDFRINRIDRHILLLAFRSEVLEVFADLAQAFDIEIGVILGLVEDRQHGLDRRLRGARGHHGDRAVNRAGTGAHALDIGGRPHAAGGVGMHLDRDLHGLDQRRHQRLAADRGKNAGHILDHDRIDVQGLHVTRQADEFLHGVEGAGRVANGSLRMATIALDALDGLLHVANIVERIEDTEDVHAVLAGELNETVEHIVGIVLVADHVLPAQQHLQRGLLGGRLDLAQAFPRIFAQEAQTDVERGAAPDLERVVAGVVDGVNDTHDILGAHARRPE